MFKRSTSKKRMAGGNADATEESLDEETVETSGAAIITLYLVGAQDVPAIDRGGTSDPYAKVRGKRDVNGRKIKTRALKKRTNATWNEKFELRVGNVADFELHLSVWDKGLRSKQLGSCVLRSAELDFSAGPVCKKRLALDTRGSLDVAVELSDAAMQIYSRMLPALVEEEEEEDSTAEEVTQVMRTTQSSMPHEPGAMRIAVSSVRKLKDMRPAGLFVRLADAIPRGGDQEGRTRALTSDDKDLVWGDSFVIDVPNVASWGVECHLMRGVECVGRVHLTSEYWQLSKLGESRWVPLEDDVPGEVQFSLRRVEAQGRSKFAKGMPRPRTGVHSFKVRVVRAEGLRARDPVASDPYYIVSSNMLPSEQRSSVVPNTTDPVWPEDEVYEVSTSDPFSWWLVLSLWDKDVGSVKQSLGFVQLFSEDWQEDGVQERWMPVQEGKGRVLVRLQPPSSMAEIREERQEVKPRAELVKAADERMATLLRASAPQFATQDSMPVIQRASPAAVKAHKVAKKRDGLLRLHLIECAGLEPVKVARDVPDLFLRMREPPLDAEQNKVRTAVVKNNVTPVWDEWFEVRVEDITDWRITLELLDKNLIGTDTVGTIELDGNTWPLQTVGEDRWVPLKAPAQGRVRVGVAVSEETLEDVNRILEEDLGQPVAEGAPSPSKRGSLMMKPVQLSSSEGEESQEKSADVPVVSEETEQEELPGFVLVTLMAAVGLAEREDGTLPQSQFRVAKQEWTEKRAAARNSTLNAEFVAEVESLTHYTIPLDARDGDRDLGTVVLTSDEHGGHGEVGKQSTVALPSGGSLMINVCHAARKELLPQSKRKVSAQLPSDMPEEVMLRVKKAPSEVLSELHGPGIVTVHVVRAEGLAVRDKLTKSSDPYVVLKGFDKDGAPMKTSTKKRTLAPEWNESFQIAVPNVRHWEIEAHVWDHDTTSKDDPMGVARLHGGAVSNLVPGEWVDLEDLNDKPCTGRIKFTYEVTGKPSKLDEAASAGVVDVAQAEHDVVKDLNLNASSKAASSAPPGKEELAGAVEVARAEGGVVNGGELDNEGASDVERGVSPPNVILKGDPVKPSSGAPKGKEEEEGEEEGKDGGEDVQDKRAADQGKQDAAPDADKGEKEEHNEEGEEEEQGPRGGFVILNVIEANDLSIRDKLTKSSDPYVVVGEFKTKVQKKTLAPVWREKFRVPVDDVNSWEITARLFDSDIGKDDALGKVTIRGNRAARSDCWLDLEDDGGKHCSGALKVGWTVEDPAAKAAAARAAATAPPALPPKRRSPEGATGGITQSAKGGKAEEEAEEQGEGENAALSSGAGFVCVTVHRAEGLLSKDKLSKSSDPFVTLEGLDVQGSKMQTSVVKKSLQPTWNETFNVPVEDVSSWKVRISVADHDNVGKADDMGSGVLAGNADAQPSVWVDLDTKGRVLFSYRVHADASGTAQPGNVTVTVHEGNDLLPKGAYVMMGAPSKKKQRTKKEKNHAWEFPFQFPVSDTRLWKRHFYLMQDKGVKSTTLGSFSVDAAGENQWVDVDGAGAVRVRLSAAVEEGAADSGGSKRGMRKSRKGGDKRDTPVLGALLSPRKGANPGRVRVYVYSAKGLTAADKNNSSDPFVVCEGDGVRHVRKMSYKTSVKKQTLEPNWSEELVVEVPNVDDWSIRLAVYDHDLIGKDPLGSADISGTRATNVESEDVPLTGPGSGQGVLTVGYEVLSERAEEPAVTSPGRRVPMPAHREGVVRVRIAGIKDVPASVKSVSVTMPADVALHTPSLENPGEGAEGSWKDATFNMTVADVSRWEAVFVVVTHKESGEEKPLGSFTVQSAKYDLKPTFDFRWLPVEGHETEVKIGFAIAKESAATLRKCKAALRYIAQQEEALAGNRNAALLMAIEGDQSLPLAIPGTVRLTLGSGRNLGARTNGYCKLYGINAFLGSSLRAKEGSHEVRDVHDKKVRTETKKREANPVWNETFEVAVDDIEGSTLVLGVFDDKLGVNKELGTTRIPLRDFDLAVEEEEERWYPVGYSEDVDLQPAVSVRLSATPASRAKLVAEHARESAVLASDLEYPEMRSSVVLLRILAGRNLVSRDSNGLSDPYVKVPAQRDAFGKPVCTKVVKKTLAPVWDEVFAVPVPDVSTFDWTLAIYDQDIGADDEMGYCTVHGEDWNFADGEETRWLQVGGSGEGQLQVGVAPTPHCARLLKRVARAKALGKAPKGGAGASYVETNYSSTLNVRIISAEGLRSADKNGLSDPYVMIPKSFMLDVNGNPVKTKVVRKTLDPKWDQMFEVFLPDLRNFDFQLTLMDWDLGKDEPLGFARVHTPEWDAFYHTGVQTKTLPVEDGDGHLIVQLSCTESGRRVIARIKEDAAAVLAAKKRQAAIDAEKAMRKLRAEQKAERMRLAAEMFPKRVGTDPMHYIFYVVCVAMALHILSRLVFTGLDVYHYFAG